MVCNAMKTLLKNKFGNILSMSIPARVSCAITLLRNYTNFE